MCQYVHVCAYVSLCVYVCMSVCACVPVCAPECLCVRVGRASGAARGLGRNPEERPWARVLWGTGCWDVKVHWMLQAPAQLFPWLWSQVGDAG